MLLKWEKIEYHFIVFTYGVVRKTHESAIRILMIQRGKRCELV